LNYIFALFSGLDFWGYLVPGIFTVACGLSIINLGLCKLPNYSILFDNGGNILVVLLISYFVGLMLQAWRHWKPSGRGRQIGTGFNVEDSPFENIAEREHVHVCAKVLFSKLFGDTNHITTGNDIDDLKRAKSYAFIIMSQECPTAFTDAYRLANVSSLMKSFKQATKLLGIFAIIVGVITYLRTWRLAKGWEYATGCIVLGLILLITAKILSHSSRWFNCLRNRQILRWMCYYVRKESE
jgi:hypothetical protein